MMWHHLTFSPMPNVRTHSLLINVLTEPVKYCQESFSKIQSWKGSCILEVNTNFFFFSSFFSFHSPSWTPLKLVDYLCNLIAFFFKETINSRVWTSDEIKQILLPPNLIWSISLTFKKPGNQFFNLLTTPKPF